MAGVIIANGRWDAVLESWARRWGELNRPRDPDLPIAKVLDSPANLKTPEDFSQNECGPKTAGKDPDNPENPTGSGRPKGNHENNNWNSMRCPGVRTVKRDGEDENIESLGLAALAVAANGESIGFGHYLNENA
jgi:hypothetical protein